MWWCRFLENEFCVKAGRAGTPESSISDANILEGVTGQVCRWLLGWECPAVSIAPSSLYILGALAVGSQQAEHLVYLNPDTFLKRLVVYLYSWSLENTVSCVLSLLEGSMLAVCR